MRRWDDNIRMDLKEIGVNTRNWLFRFRLGLIREPLWILHWSSIFLHSVYMTCPSQSSGLNHPIYIRWTVQTMSLLHSPFASLLGPNIRLRFLHPNPSNLYLASLGNKGTFLKIPVKAVSESHKSGPDITVHNPEEILYIESLSRKLRQYITYSVFPDKHLPRL